MMSDWIDWRYWKLRWYARYSPATGTMFSGVRWLLGWDEDLDYD